VSSSASTSVSTVNRSAEPDGDFRSEADESVSSDPSADVASSPAEPLVVDDDVLVDEEDFLVDEESLVDDDESDGVAYAMAGVLAMANPTPRVTASAPTRPTYLA
jgi:hypothetical protein